MKIVAVVVTFNRHQLLSRFLRQLMCQTRPPDEICIIDNASSDETSSIVARDFPDLFYFRSETNLGGAGGFALAMELFLEGDGDALLICDDDGTASPTMLETLEMEIDHLPFANALVVDQADAEALAFTLSRTARGTPLRRSLTSVSDMQSTATDGIVFDLACPFNGTLLRRDLIESVGIVSHRMFIWGDEIEYMARTINKGFRLGTVVSAALQHPRSSGLVKTSVLVGAMTIPNRERAHFAFRNGGHIDALRKRRLRGVLGCVKRSAKLLMLGEWRLGVMLPLYYFDGLFGTFSLSPTQASLDEAYLRQRARLSQERKRVPAREPSHRAGSVRL